MMFQKPFCMFKTIVIIVLFSKCPFLKIKCAPFLLKIEKDLNIDDYKSKGT